MNALYSTSVANAKSAEKDYKLSDGGGLNLLVKANGTKLWRLNYRYLGKHHTLAFGSWPDVSLANARSRRDDARALIVSGFDPSHEQKVAPARACLEENNSFKIIAEEWVTKNEREGLAEITLRKSGGCLRWPIPGSATGRSRKSPPRRC